MIRPLSFILFVFTTCLSFSQINTERYRQTYGKLGWYYTLDAAFGYSTGNTEELTVDGRFRIDVNGKKQDYFAILNYDFKAANHKKSKDNAFIHLRTIGEFSPKYYWEIFGQTEYNEFLLLNHRYLIGAGMRIDVTKIINPDKGKTERKFDFYFGLGAMVETENYDIETGDTIINLVRITSYISMLWSPTDIFNITFVNYYQPDITYFSNFRYRATLNLEFKISKKFSFIAKVDYLHRNRPIGGTLPNDLEIKNGIKLQLP